MALSRSFTPDLVIKNLDSDPIGIVEVVGGTYMSRDYAIEIRQNMLRSGLPTHVPYFLILSQDLGYLWKDSEQNGPDTPPTYEFPMGEIVKQYSTGDTNRRLPRIELEYVMLKWLTILSIKPQEATEEAEEILAASGFINAIEDAMVLIEEKL